MVEEYSMWVPARAVSMSSLCREFELKECERLGFDRLSDSRFSGLEMALLDICLSLSCEGWEALIS